MNYNKQNYRFVIKFIFFWFCITIFLNLTHRNKNHTYAFGPLGPYTHHRILYESILQFSNDIKMDFNPSCTLLLYQFAYDSDSIYGDKDYYHCDNGNFSGCSLMLETLKNQSKQSINLIEVIRNFALASHIVQDFYAHSNWVEKNKFSLILAPIELFKDIPPQSMKEFKWLQSGIYPDENAVLLSNDILVNYYCLILPEDLWDEYFPNAGHACINKDGNFGRGAYFVNGSYMTYHELAALYAIKHTVELLHWYKKNVPLFRLCLVPFSSFFNCNTILKEEF
ncbi:MAG: hypothetical protein KatS3mg129_0299 [Leptospiraceae bacterium]|nr:MAG: hypothetical protein KatS3mg129_0299 [Leptospiraceae bacterium]